MGLDDLHHESRPTSIFNDILSWSHGSHTFKFAGEARTLQNNLRNDNNGSGTFGFCDLNTGVLGINSGSSVASFLLGYVNNASVSFNNVNTLYARGRLFALRAGDTWKATSKLSITYGLRWEHPVGRKVQQFLVPRSERRQFWRRRASRPVGLCRK